MTSIHDFVGGDYLKAADLNGQEPTHQVAGFGIEDIKSDDGKERKVVMELVGLQKKMVCGSKAVATTLLEIFKTDQVEQWDAHVKQNQVFVQLHTEQTNFGPGLRIRSAQQPAAVLPQQPAAPQQQLTPEMMAQIQHLLQNPAGG